MLLYFPYKVHVSHSVINGNLFAFLPKKIERLAPSRASIGDGGDIRRSFQTGRSEALGPATRCVNADGFELDGVV